MIGRRGSKRQGKDENPQGGELQELKTPPLGGKSGLEGKRNGFMVQGNSEKF